nr:LRR receptor-like serine/threonine-protein kinase GSO1 [Ipomoea batatas]
MRRLQLLQLLWGLLIVLQWSGECCLEEERRALHQIKAFFISSGNLPEYDSEHVLPSWIDDDDTDCCRWDRVVCNPITSRIRDLTLYGLVDGLSQNCLNFSLFIPFKELESIRLSGNAFNCIYDTHGFDKLIHLKRLETLNLAGNYFGTEILRPLGAVTQLRSLLLGGNSFFNTLPADLQGQGGSIFKLNKLQHLDLSGNYIAKKVILKSLCNLVAPTFLSLESNEIEGTLSSDDVGCLKNIQFLKLGNNRLNGSITLQAFTSLKNLKVLDLSFNGFGGSIPPAVGNLSALFALSLRKNNLTGILPDQEFCNLKNLEELDLSDNRLEGVLPSCFCNLTSLSLLDLSANQFRGDFSFIFPTLVQSLEYIRLGDNQFHTKFAFNMLANHSKVKLVELLNNDNIEVETEDDLNWIPKFQLEVLILPDCNLNKQSLRFPTFLAYQSMLKLLDLSDNNLRGGFPNWIINNNSGLLVLNLRNNSLEGQLHLQPHLNTSIISMDLSDNQLHGKLQENMGRMLPQMVFLKLSRNYFEGLVLSTFCNMSQLFMLDLSSNYFNGEIAKEIISGCLHNLDILSLFSNRFNGQIFSTPLNMTGLNVLSLEDNQFSGPISITFNNNLRFLDASNNQFSGELNNFVSNTTGPFDLFIRSNALNGQLPCKVVSQLTLLDLSHNSLSGPLPTCTSLALHILLRSNKFTGPIPETLLNSSNLVTLDIRDNNLSGNLPFEIGAAENLRILLLGGNQLSGSFPNQLCSLQKLNLIDLSHNYLSGQVPRCINNITFGKSNFRDVFNVSYSSEETVDKVIMYGNFLVKEYKIYAIDGGFDEVLIYFITKRRFNPYKGYILNYMSGLDLSCNNFTGEIPYGLGELTQIHTLNLSHNQIKGSIPTTFSGLTQLESLDLSYNNLTGKVPPDLIDLTFLAFFSVAHNNLSGKIPEMKGQFATFDQSSYEGNPYLCGVLLANKCNHIVESPSSPTPASEFTSERKCSSLLLIDLIVHVDPISLLLLTILVLVVGWNVIDSEVLTTPFLIRMIKNFPPFRINCHSHPKGSPCSTASLSTCRHVSCGEVLKVQPKTIVHTRVQNAKEGNIDSSCEVMPSQDKVALSFHITLCDEVPIEGEDAEDAPKS